MSYLDVSGDDYSAGDYDVLGAGYDVLGDDLMGLSFGRMANLALNPVAQYNALRGAGRGRSAGRAATAPRQLTGGAAVRATPPSQSRRLYLGVDSSSNIASTATSNITVQSVEPYRPEVFAVSPAIASSFIITDIKIGRKSQLVGTGSISADTLSALSPLSGVEFDTAQTSQPLVVSVQNISGAALRFMATLIGTAVE